MTCRPTILVLCTALLATACGSSLSESGGQAATLGSLSFDAPEDWKRTDSATAGSLTAVWTPDPAANDRKESVAVIRSVLPGSRGKPSPAMVERLLAGAQGTLRNARVSTVTAVTTSQGVTGARIDVTFQPGTGTQRYRRTHVILVDADASALIHVLYTAAQPDEGLDAFQLVLDSIRRQEG